MLLTDAAVKNRTTVAVLALIIVLLGCYSYMSLPREAAPDIPIPYILVTTIYEGVSPEDIETSVTMKIEKELGGVRGVEEVTSSSAEGMSMISVEFAPDVPSEVALQRLCATAWTWRKGSCPRTPKSRSSKRSISPSCRSCSSASPARFRPCCSRRSPTTSRTRWSAVPGRVEGGDGRRFGA